MEIFAKCPFEDTRIFQLLTFVKSLLHPLEWGQEFRIQPKIDEERAALFLLLLR